MNVRNQRGFTLIELMITVAIIGILFAIAVPIYANVTATARIAKAQADVRTLVGASLVYSAHMGLVPANLNALTGVARNAYNIDAGPFVPTLPTPPSGWGSAYTYVGQTATGVFTISAAGDGTTVKQP